MADQLVLALDMSKDPGERLSVEARTEIAVVAPSAVLNNSITEAKLKDAAVTNPKLAPGAVKSPNIAAGEVKTANVAAEAITEPLIADGAVPAAKTGLGVMTMQDDAGNFIQVKGIRMTETEFAGITPDPNGFYFLSS